MLATIFSFFKIIGSLGLFIYGMKTMSEGIQRAAGSQLRNILRSMTKNRFLGVFSGFFLTALVQSSSATTVMTVSFVNAGLLSLVESAGIMIGANIGTTITGWLVALGSGNFELSEYVLPLLGVGLPLIFFNKGNLKFWGEFLIGFGLLFLGLNFLKESVPNLQSNPELLQFLTDYANSGYLSIISFVIIGAIITIIIQSSSAAMALTLVMLSKGWIPMETAAAMILGENIGTTVTAELASLVGNVHAKRSARIHSFFNLIGVFWMIIFLPIFVPILNTLVQNTIMPLFPSADQSTFTIAAFHTSFNLANALLLVGFIPWLIVLAKKTIRSKGEADKTFRLEYINSLVSTPELSILEVQKEVIKFGELITRMAGFSRELFMSTDPVSQKEIFKRIKKYEAITDRVELELGAYLTKISGDKIAPDTSLKIKNILSVCSELERAGNIYLQLSKNLKRKAEKKIWFNQAQRERMNNMFDLVDDAIQTMNKNLAVSDYRKIQKHPAEAIEKRIDRFKKDIRKENFKHNALQEDIQFNADSQILFTIMINQLEKVGNALYNVTEAFTESLPENI